MVLQEGAAAKDLPLLRISVYTLRLPMGQGVAQRLLTYRKRRKAKQLLATTDLIRGLRYDGGKRKDGMHPGILEQTSKISDACAMGHI